MGYRRDDHFAEENIKPPQFGNIRSFLKSQGIAEENIPFWAQSQSDFDGDFGILVTMTCFIDSVQISMPYGKRELGETSWETACREVNEELSGRLDLNKNFSVDNDSHLYKWQIKYHMRPDPKGGIQTFVVLAEEVDTLETTTSKLGGL